PLQHDFHWEHAKSPIHRGDPDDRPAAEYMLVLLEPGGAPDQLTAACTRSTSTRTTVEAGHATVPCRCVCLTTGARTRRISGVQAHSGDPRGKRTNRRAWTTASYSIRSDPAHHIVTQLKAYSPASP